MTNALQQAFEKRATELGFKIRKDSNGKYIYEHTNRLWLWYEAGAHSVLEFADPNYDMTPDKDSFMFHKLNPQ